MNVQYCPQKDPVNKCEFWQCRLWHLWFCSSRLQYCLCDWCILKVYFCVWVVQVVENVKLMSSVECGVWTPAGYVLVHYLLYANVINVTFSSFVCLPRHTLAWRATVACMCVTNWVWSAHACMQALLCTYVVNKLYAAHVRLSYTHSVQSGHD